jgi:hypothetical protein
MPTFCAVATVQYRQIKTSGKNFLINVFLKWSEETGLTDMISYGIWYFKRWKYLSKVIAICNADNYLFV